MSEAPDTIVYWRRRRARPRLPAIGFRLGRGFAGAAGLTELTAVLLIALGFLGPACPALLLSVMVVAVITVNWRNGLLATSNGSELPLLYITAAISLAFVGFGRYSLDAALGLRIGRPGSSGRSWLGRARWTHERARRAPARAVSGATQPLGEVPAVT